MATFATGKYALALCDRCGQQYKFSQLQEEWNGLMTCPECFETKHPQLDRQEPVTVFVGAPGDSAFTSNGMQPSTQTRDLNPVTSVGTVTIVIS
jgi:NAD-dependent SIR2 family protein deacetylase